MTDPKCSHGKGLQLLSQCIYHDAMVDYPTYPPPSLNYTVNHEARNEVLGKILSWIEDPNPVFPVLWLHGSAGSGKSSLAQTITEICRVTSRLGGSFFFRRGAEGRDQGSHIFPTIAFQLALNIPDFHDPIDNAMYNDVILASIDTQFQSLIVEPIQNAASVPLCNSIVIIDGLDACQGHNIQELILKRIAQAATASKLPIQFIVTSRTEPQILQIFNTDMLCGITRTIPLDDLFDLPTDGHSSEANNLHWPLLPPRWRWSAPKIPCHIPSYPRIVTLQQSNGNTESYSRSLLMAGHGFPLWNPAGDLGKPIDYLRKGVSIGDVGTLDNRGIFNFCFNIFLSADNPVHARSVPREFRPIDPPLHPSEVKFVQEYFKPGDVVTSEGIDVQRYPESPLDFCFKSTKQEGGILILPAGASREDLLTTHRFHEYTKMNAPHWYQVINGYGGVVHANGSLFLVTGCDKAANWALASFPSHPGNVETCIDLRYTWQPEYAPPWSDDGTAQTRFYAPPRSKNIPNVGNMKNQCVFIRGMRISLTEPSWKKTMPYQRSTRLQYSYMLHKTPKLRCWLDSVLVFLHLRLSERRSVKKATPSRLHLFHPNFVIGQVLLAKHPDAEVAFVNDSVWCSLVGGRPCTMSEMNKLVTGVFDMNRIVEKDGIITLIPKTSEERENVHKSTLEGFTQKILSRLPNYRSKDRPEKHPPRWVKEISVVEHAKLF